MPATNHVVTAMPTKKEDRAKNPPAGQVAFSNFQFPADLQNKMVLTAEQYAVVGKIIVVWAQIDADVTTALFLLKGLAGNEDDVLALDGLPLASKIQKVAALIDDHELHESILRLEAFVEEEKWKRDALAHGTLLFDTKANASFFLLSRKRELLWTEVESLEGTSAAAAEIARSTYVRCLTNRPDRRGTPFHWTVENFSTSIRLSIGVESALPPTFESGSRSSQAG